MSTLHEAVDVFLGDPRVQKLLDLARETRPLRVCYPREIPVSRFLAWILDPTEGHGLNDVCIRSLLGEAWRRCDEADIDSTLRHALAPTAVAGQSFDACLVKREVKLGSNSLDVLVLDPKNHWLLAVENKFGAGEGRGQLKRYSTALAELYPTWTRLLIFLDVFGQPPSDTSWIGLDYQWLVDEIAAAEGSPWLGADSKSALREFRSAVEPEGDAFVHVDVDDDLLLEVVDEHRVVFAKMQEWSRSRQSIHHLVNSVFGSSRSQDEKATQQLLRCYWQRRRLWDVCVPMLLYAGLLKAARAAFPNAMCDPKRKAFYFSLPEWYRLAEDHTEQWSVYIMVRILPEKDETGLSDYVVVSYVNLGQVPERLHSMLLPVVRTLRSEHLRRKKTLKDEPGYVTVQIDRTSDEESVSNLLVKHLRDLQLALETVR